MVRMIPKLSDTAIALIRSKAEREFYVACREQLFESRIVIHSINFVTHLSSRRRDGEADFVIFCPDRGFLVIEVKGGGIAFDREEAQWSSTDSYGNIHEIKNPFEQGKLEKHAIIKYLQQYPEWNRLQLSRITTGHAVFFPDLSIYQLDDLVTPESPREIMGGEQDLQQLDAWVDRVFKFWVGTDSFHPLGKLGMQFIEEKYCKPREVKPLISHQIRDEEKLRIQLTEQQAWYLRSLGERKRAAITGGAGTGKTLLAMHKAEELARDGKRTLLVCFNRPLANHLKDVAGLKLKDTLLPMSFHELCTWRIQVAYSQTGQNLEETAQSDYPDKDYFHVQLPYALALSADLLPDDKFDAIIVDEGQDFRADYWMGLEMLLRDEEHSYFYVFYDPNQALYQSADYIRNVMHNEHPMPLTMNCRNTKYIHDAAYKFYRGYPIDPPRIDGAPIDIMCGSTLEEQKTDLHDLVSTLIKNEEVDPSDITILVASSNLDKYSSLLKSLTLHKGMKYSIKKHRVQQTILVDTVARFKGLESAIIILWGLDEFDPIEDYETLYVAYSRAKSRLYLIGSDDACRKAIDAHIDDTRL